MAGDWLTATEATALLGVKAATLYAYVSRGLVRRERPPGQRTSRYARADVERLAGRRRGAGGGAALDVVIESGLTLLDPSGHLYYRGWDVTDAADAGFEAVAQWLWTGERATEEIVLPTPTNVPRIEGAEGIDLVRAVLAATRPRATDDHDRRA